MLSWNAQLQSLLGWTAKCYFDAIALEAEVELPAGHVQAVSKAPVPVLIGNHWSDADRTV